MRARWAKLLFAGSGVLGLAYGVVHLMLDTRWLVLSKIGSYRLHNVLDTVSGLLLGFLLSLVFSGQARGMKRQDASHASI